MDNNTEISRSTAQRAKYGTISMNVYITTREDAKRNARQMGMTLQDYMLFVVTQHSAKLGL